MLFIHTWEKVLSGEKTQTRRIVKPAPAGFVRIGETSVYDQLDAGFIAVDENDEVIAVPRILTVHYQHGGWLNGDVCVEPDAQEQVKYEVGRKYAVQPGRGQKAVARIQITDIRREDVRDISDADVKAEGFADKKEFLLVWASMHDKAFFKDYSSFYLGTAGLAEEQWYERKYQGVFSRTTHFYDAWVLEFKLVKDNE